MLCFNGVFAPATGFTGLSYIYNLRICKLQLIVSSKDLIRLRTRYIRLTEYKLDLQSSFTIQTDLS